MSKQVLYYSGLIWGKFPISMGVGISILALLLAYTDANTPVSIRPEVTTRYLIWLGGIGAILAAVTIFRPERPFENELLATVSTSMPGIILSRWSVVSLFLVSPSWIALLGATLLANRPVLESWVPSAFTFLSAIVLFGGVTIFFSAISRQSLMGILGGLLLLISVSIFPIPERFMAINLLRSGEAWIQPDLWWGSRLVYLLIGLFLGWVGSTRLGNFDYLLTGEKTRSSKSIISNSTTKQNLPHGFLVFTRNAFPLGSRVLANEWVYDAWQVMLRGGLPIAVLSLVILTCGLAIMGLDWELHLAIDAPRTAMMFGTLIIPLLTCDTVPAERRTNTDQLLLTVLSLPEFIKFKTIGNVIVILLAFMIGSLPVLMLLLSRMTIEPRLSIAGLAMWYGIALPFLLYLATISTLLGALMSRRSGYAIGAAVAVTGIILYFLAGEIPIINYFFPCGPAAADTFLGWVQGTPFQRLSGPSLNVPIWTLSLSFLSAVIQIFLLYRVSIANLLRRAA